MFADARSSLLFSPRLREGKGLLVMAPLFASHLCCDWNHINFDAVSLLAPHPPPCRAYDHCWVGLSLSILFLLVIWKRNLAADLFYYFYYYFFFCFCIYSESVFDQCCLQTATNAPVVVFFFLLKCIPIRESKKTKRNSRSETESAHLERQSLNFAASKQKLSDVLRSWSASRVNLQGFCEALR